MHFKFVTGAHLWKKLEKHSFITFYYRYMYWSDWGNEPRIERSDMDGKNRKVIVSNNLGWPNGLTIDVPTNRIIWADARTEVWKHLS